MKSLTIKTPGHSYEVIIGNKLRHSLSQYLPRDYSKILVITDQTVSSLYLNDVLSSLKPEKVEYFIVPSGEASKNIDCFHQCHTAAIRAGLDRSSLIIALGGGVIGDLAGFVAATFMRGIDYLQVPTTILAHDSSVGGKVAINHQEGKNLIGNFHQPVAVIYDLETLMTLSEKEIRSGFAEIIKHAWISNEDFLSNILTEVTSFSELNMKKLEEMLLSGISVKANIVAEDEKEKGIRRYLNFGHTLGHALESDLGYGSITHGEAVAYGMLFALFVSREHFGAALKFDEYKDWLNKLDYPLEFELNHSRIIERMKHDKKNQNNHISFVLLKQTGEPSVVALTEVQVKDYLKRFKSEVFGG